MPGTGWDLKNTAIYSTVYHNVKSQKHTFLIPLAREYDEQNQMKGLYTRVGIAPAMKQMLGPDDLEAPFALNYVWSHSANYHISSALS